jgi:hypothetical protein
MTLPETDVARLKGELERAQAESARLRQEAQAAADRLIKEPTSANQERRDELAKRAELIDLQTARLVDDWPRPSAPASGLGLSGVRPGRRNSRFGLARSATSIGWRWPGRTTSSAR